MRLLVAVDIPDHIRQAISAHVDELRRIAPDAKWVRPESYHITLKFIGEWKRDVKEMIEVMKTIEAPRITISIRGQGFFPNARSPRVFWVGIESEPWVKVEASSDHISAECGDGLPSPSGLQVLASKVDSATATLGIEKQDRAFSPHLTLARSGSGSPRPKKDERAVPSMKRLAERIVAMPIPDFGAIHATEFFLYESKLSPSGAQYTKLKGFPLV